MENKLKKAFDYQKFENNSRLAKLIAETEARYGDELTDDSLELVNAAGEQIRIIEGQPVEQEKAASQFV
ncbi:MAG: hypothetical protein MJ085_05540 [Clostridia bacterium]|nr:hypothetical protein [Clostridia bacterium]